MDARRLMTDGYQLWHTQGGAVLARDAIPPKYIVRIIHTKSLVELYKNPDCEKAL